MGEQPFGLHWLVYIHLYVEFYLLKLRCAHSVTHCMVSHQMKDTMNKNLLLAKRY